MSEDPLDYSDPRTVEDLAGLYVRTRAYALNHHQDEKLRPYVKIIEGKGLRNLLSFYWEELIRLTGDAKLAQKALSDYSASVYAREKATAWKKFLISADPEVVTEYNQDED